jgi:Mrp family chromosome partitioning ATPase
MVDLHARRPAQSAPMPGHGAAEGMVVAHLDVLPFAEAYRSAGVIPPAEARAAIESYGAAYDWIVLDGPPVLESPDSATLAAVADGVVIVVQANRTKRPVLIRAVDLLRKAGGRVLGTVLNRRRLEIPEFIYRRI